MFLWQTLCCHLRSESKIFLPVAGSGIAATLLPSGHTAHSRFKIPLKLDQNSIDGIKHGTNIAELIKDTNLIIWDDAPMQHRHVIEAVDRSLRDIVGAVDLKNAQNHLVELLSFFVNMRLHSSNTDSRNKIISEFSKWQLDIGDGKVKSKEAVNDEFNGEFVVAEQFVIQSDAKNPLNTLINIIYPDLLENLNCEEYLRSRAILTPRNVVVDDINSNILEKIPDPLGSNTTTSEEPDTEGTGTLPRLPLKNLLGLRTTSSPSTVGSPRLIADGDKICRNSTDPLGSNTTTSEEPDTEGTGTLPRLPLKNLLGLRTTSSPSTVGSPRLIADGDKICRCVAVMEAMAFNRINSLEKLRSDWKIKARVTRMCATTFHPCGEDIMIPEHKFEFFDLGDVFAEASKLSQNENPEFAIDIIGVVEDFEHISKIETKFGDRDIVKFRICDHSNRHRVDVWGDLAKIVDADFSKFDNGEIVFVIIASVKMGSVQLSTLPSSKVYFNLAHESVFEMSQRLEEEGYKPRNCGNESNSIVPADSPYERSSLKFLNENAAQCVNAKLFCKLTVSKLEQDKTWFIYSCIKCQSEVVEIGKRFNCEKCTRNMPVAEKRFSVKAAVTDASFSCYVFIKDRVVKRMVSNSASQLYLKQIKVVVL
ncbi:hypothetical protein AgCh_028684 [Apium graveolens]